MVIISDLKCKTSLLFLFSPSPQKKRFRICYLIKFLKSSYFLSIWYRWNQFLRKGLINNLQMKQGFYWSATWFLLDFGNLAFYFVSWDWHKLCCFVGPHSGRFCWEIQYFQTNNSSGYLGSIYSSCYV